MLLRIVVLVSRTGAHHNWGVLYMVVEHLKAGHAEDIYRRFRDRGRMAPDGLRYVASWTETSFARCFQVMEADDPALLEAWMASWRDLIDFEVQPVYTSADAAAAIAPRL